MTLANIMLESSSDNEFDIFIEKYNALLDKTYNEIIATEADKSSSGAIADIKKSKDAAIDKAKASVNRTVTRVKKFFSKDKKDIIEKANKAASTNPKVKEKKVDGVRDPKEIEKIFNKGLNDIEKIKVKIKAGKATEEDMKTIDDIVDNTIKTEKEFKAKVAVGIATAIALLLVAIKMFEDHTDSSDDDVLEFNYDTSMNPDDNIYAMKATSASLKLINKKYIELENCAYQLYKEIKYSITGMTELDLDGIIKESKEVKLTDNNSKEYLENLMNIIDSEKTVVENHSEEDEIEAKETTENNFDVEKELAFIESSLEEENKHTVTIGEYLESMESELFGEDNFDANEELATIESALEINEVTESCDDKFIPEYELALLECSIESEE